ncbi:MAG: hypothetical protein ABIR06_19835 [Cyclobacteriaceae bacterium]
MSYLLIKKDDAKIFKAFLSGNEIEVSVLIGSQANVFDAGEEVYIFYDNDDSDSYKARVTSQKRWVTNPGDQTLLRLGIVKR